MSASKIINKTFGKLCATHVKWCGFRSVIITNLRTFYGQLKLVFGGHLLGQTVDIIFPMILHKYYRYDGCTYFRTRENENHTTENVVINTVFIFFFIGIIISISTRVFLQRWPRDVIWIRFILSLTLQSLHSSLQCYFTRKVRKTVSAYVIITILSGFKNSRRHEMPINEYLIIIFTFGWLY